MRYLVADAPPVASGIENIKNKKIIDENRLKKSKITMNGKKKKKKKKKNG